MHTRIPIDSAARRAVHKRDGRSCRKCGRRRHLDIHHIQAIVDGGSDEVENLVTLCRVCHNEWHYMVRPFGLIPFERWLDLPAAVVVLNWFVSMEDDPAIKAMPLGEAKQALMIMWDIAREQARTSP